MKPIVIDDPREPLGAITAALLREFPRSGILGVGLGRRRHERARDGHLDEGTVVKIVLRRKRRPLPRNVRRIPRHLTLAGRLLGHGYTVRIPTDLEQATTAVPTQYELGPLFSGSVCLAAFARWEEEGRTRTGGITAGHGFWRTADSGAHKRLAPLKLGAGATEPEIEVRVRCASHLARHGVDVALVEFPDGTPDGLHASMTHFFPRAPRPAAVADLLARLGDADDALVVPALFRHFSLSPSGVEAVAYYPERVLQVQGWGTVTLKGAVESQAPASTFLPGTSGSGVVTLEGDALALGVQSLCLDPGDVDVPSGFLRGLATSFDAGLSWLREDKGFDVTPFWRW